MNFPTIRPNGANYVRPRQDEAMGITPPGFCWWRAAERGACHQGRSENGNDCVARPGNIIDLSGSRGDLKGRLPFFEQAHPLIPHRDEHRITSQTFHQPTARFVEPFVIGNLNPCGLFRLLPVRGDRCDAPVEIEMISFRIHGDNLAQPPRRRNDFAQESLLDHALSIVFQDHRIHLRDRVLQVALHFVQEFAKTNGKPTVGVNPNALQALTACRWPGNVRELRNVIERAVILCSRPLIGLEELPSTVTRPSQPVAGEASPLGKVTIPVGATVEQAERDLIMKTLEATGQNKTRAAEILGISLKTLHNKLKKYRQ